MQSNDKRISVVNGIVSLIITIIECIVTFSSKTFFVHAIFTVWLFIIFLYLGLVKKGIMYISIYFFSLFWLTELAPLGVTFPSPMLFGMIYKFIVPIMAGYITISIPSGKLIALLYKLPVPRSITLITIVMIRFAPTVSGEFKEVRDAMAVRGFLGDFRRVLLHPLKTLEYSFVPIIFRSIKVGDELAAASIVRGIENPCKKSSYYENNFSKVDYIVLIPTILIGIFSVVY